MVGELITDAFESEDGERSGAHAEIFPYFADLVHERRAAGATTSSAGSCTTTAAAER